MSTTEDTMPLKTTKRSETHLRQEGKDAFLAGNYQLAIETLSIAAAMPDSGAWTWLWLSRATYATGLYRESTAAARHALELNPEWQRAADQLFEALIARSNDPEAMMELREYVLAYPNDSKLFARMLTQMLDLDALDEVKFAANELLRIDPSGKALRREASARGKAGDDRRLALLLDALPDTSIRGEIVDSIARPMFVAGQSLRAWELVRTCSTGAISPSLLRQSATALWRGGHIDQAIMAIDRATEVAGNNESLLLKREAMHGEARVLRGEWQPAPERPTVVTPIPGRVLHIVRTSLPYVEVGYTIRTQSIAIAQRKVGLNAHVVSKYGFPMDRGRSDAAAFELVDGVPHHRIAADQPTPLRLDDELDLSVVALKATVDALRPAVLHVASDYRNAFVALEVGRLTGIPVVYEVRGFWEETWLSKRDAESIDAQLYACRRAREMDAMWAADHIVTLSEGMRDALVDRGLARDDITIVENAVDLELFTPVTRNQQLAEALGFAPDHVILGYISSFTEYEGIRYLIEAIAILLEAGHRVGGLLVGDGSELDALKAQAEQLGIADKIVFTGRVPHADILRYYSLIDIFVVPRTADRVSQLVTPLKPFEAMATGRAVVLSGVDALRGMILEGKTGVTFRPEDPQDLAAVVSPVVNNPLLRQSLGLAAREWVVANRSWRQNGERYLELYRSMGIPLPDMTERP